MPRKPKKPKVSRNEILPCPICDVYLELYGSMSRNKQFWTHIQRHVANSELPIKRIPK